MTGFLAGRTAFVTGSNSGIGLAIAEALASEGARVALHGLCTVADAEDAVATVEAAGAPEVRFFEGDLRDVGAIERLVETVSGWYAPDILVNNAGMQKTVSLEEADTTLWDAVIAVNLSAAFHTMRQLIPGMAARGFGRVINVASVHGLVASVHKAPYVTSKFGLIGLSRVAALEYASAGSRETGGVTVNCLCPGWVETPLIEPQIMARAAEAGGDRDAGIRGLLSEKQPSLRMAQPADIGALALFLCSHAAHNITGAALPVDGGWTAQ